MTATDMKKERLEFQPSGLLEMSIVEEELAFSVGFVGKISEEGIGVLRQTLHEAADTISTLIQEKNK